MVFNSNTYHRNKALARSMAYMRLTRDSTGDERSHYVRLVRSQWRMYLSYLRLKRMDDDYRSMSAVDFIAKYGSV